VHKLDKERPLAVERSLDGAEWLGDAIDLIAWDFVYRAFIEFHINNKCLAIACKECHDAYDGKNSRKLPQSYRNRLNRLFNTIDWSDKGNRPTFDD
jgi:hypothetical protein